MKIEKAKKASFLLDEITSLQKLVKNLPISNKNISIYINTSGFETKYSISLGLYIELKQKCRELHASKIKELENL